MLNFVFTKKKGGVFTVKTQMKFWSPGRSDSEGCMNHESYKAKTIKSPYEQKMYFFTWTAVKVERLWLI